ncbi:MAG: CotH kinase family protein [Bacteroidota bacterium]
MIRTLILTAFFLLACGNCLQAQDTFYETDQLQEIRITFSEANWSHVLDSLYLNFGDNGRLVGDVVINGQVIKKAGVRYKGFSSWNEGVIKNPFNVELDYTVKNQNYQGHTKLKLSNVIEDPSFVREVLSYEIARKYMPASRANFAKLYINDSLIGLYTSVEAVDKTFVLAHYGSSANSFFKGEPDTLVYPFGQNANLAYTHGSDSSAYKPFYNMESKVGWNDLLNFIRVLNNSTDSIPYVLNTDRALWMHAFNYTLLNLDSYIGYSQNYYIYKDNLGRFNPIVWDLNMSFGSFRESDASYNFLGIAIPKIKVLDPMELLNFCISPRPLITRLIEKDTWRKMYLAHMRTILNENFANNAFYTRARELQNEIDASVKEDTHKFYSYSDFLANADTTVGGSGTMILYPGLSDLMRDRTNYLATYPGFSGEPTISRINHEPDVPVMGSPLWITASVISAKNVTLAYRFGPDKAFTKISMLDDGNSHDGAGNDGIYGVAIEASDTLIQYYIYAENDSAGSFSPERAEYEFYTVQPQVKAGELVINEILTTGDNLLAGEDAVNNDWIEVLNTSSGTIQLTGFSLLQQPDSIYWEFPNISVPAGKFVMVWADGSGAPHAGFTLPQSGGMLTLRNSGGMAIDSVEYGWQVNGKSTGRYPNGTGSFKFMEPSPGKNNTFGSTPESGFRLYPNPAREQITVEFSNRDLPYGIEMYNSKGQCVYSRQFQAESFTSVAVPLDVSVLPGLYLVKLSTDGSVFTKKLIVY